jgi:hypothetical protein
MNDWQSSNFFRVCQDWQLEAIVSPTFYQSITINMSPIITINKWKREERRESRVVAVSFIEMYDPTSLTDRISCFEGRR